MLRRAKPPLKNIQKDILNALIALKKDPDRLLLSPDKGNCVVVIDKQEYHDKALSLLNDKSTYAVWNSDPTNKTQRKLKTKCCLIWKKLIRLASLRTKCYTVVTAYVHIFMAYLKFINREFLWDPLSLLLILRFMQFLVNLREFCRLLLGILTTLSKIPANFSDFIRDKTLNACFALH